MPQISESPWTLTLLYAFTFILMIILSIFYSIMFKKHLSVKLNFFNFCFMSL